MKVNILNELIIDPETIERVQIVSKNASRKKTEYHISFLFKDGTQYYLSYGTVIKDSTVVKNELLAKMRQDMQEIYNQITKEQ